MTASTSPLAQLQDPNLLKTQALINGQWVDGPSRFDVTDPATGQVLAQVANLGHCRRQPRLARLACADRQSACGHLDEVVSPDQPACG
jgi:succinate-semialdehyde dehydrogenase/glutarate-semialdehyde dehydrogenase